MITVHCVLYMDLFVSFQFRTDTVNQSADSTSLQTQLGRLSRTCHVNWSIVNCTDTKESTIVVKDCVFSILQRHAVRHLHKLRWLLCLCPGNRECLTCHSVCAPWWGYWFHVLSFQFDLFHSIPIQLNWRAWCIIICTGKAEKKKEPPPRCEERNDEEVADVGCILNIFHYHIIIWSWWCAPFHAWACHFGESGEQPVSVYPQEDCIFYTAGGQDDSFCVVS